LDVALTDEDEPPTGLPAALVFCTVFKLTLVSVTVVRTTGAGFRRNRPALSRLDTIFGL
jgi:hypothetical protein